MLLETSRSVILSDMCFKFLSNLTDMLIELILVTLSDFF